MMARRFESKCKEMSRADERGSKGGRQAKERFQARISQATEMIFVVQERMEVRRE